MRIPGSNRFFLNPGKKKNLAWMARNGERVYDLEKEGFSDGDSSASLEEISAEDVRKDGRRSRSRVWKDGIAGYTIASSFGSNLYSFAWAQAVQNKPLGLEMNSAWDAELEEEKKGGEDVVIGENMDDPPLLMEKEEGELEEGEIDLCSESVAEEQINVSSYTMEDESKHSESEIKESEVKEEADMEDLDRRIGEILEELDMITLEEAEASFEDVCSRLLKSFAGLKAMFVESNFPILDAPVQQAFMGIKTLNSVLCSGNLQKSKQNTDLLLRLLIHIKNQYSMLLTQEQVTEIDIMAQNLVSSDINGEKTMQSASDSGACLLSIEPPPLPRNRIEFSPLLDLHADYDEGSLPSPTRGNAQPLPIPKPISFSASVLSDPIACKKDEDEDATLHSYETDALKAVTSYQQKFGRSSVLPSNQLPSPTPSEECNHEEDKNDEVSSFSAFGNTEVLKDIGSLKSGGSSCADIIAGTLSASAKMVGWSTSQPNIVVKAKSRDPRLRLINHNANVISDHSLCTNGLIEVQANSKKHRAMEDPVMDDLSLKRQRQSSLIVKDVPLNMSTTVPETNKKLLSNEYEEVGTRKPGIGAAIADSSADADINSSHNDSNEQSTTVGSAQSVFLPALLKDMGVNTTMLMELLKMEQQRLAVESQQKTSNPEVKPPEVGKHQSTKPQIHGQVPSLDSQDNVGRIRMKPRDPRRILHNNKVQKTQVSEHEENKVGAIPCDVQYKERLIVGDLVEQAQTNTVLPHAAPPPNSWHLTKNIKNSNDGMPSSKSSNLPQSGPPICSLPIPSMANKPDGRQFVMEPNDSKAVNTSTSQAVTADSSHSTNAWEDVDHLLDGYDEQQKAAIQKERTRRIAEQNKMFAAKKLCLVLDLDHTLLNSAKFGEVDQLHEEILRIKEEQDREKPQRHLFRFQHMGMWTKLRPGVWNFLEKASKIFELHLYTMGNKLYATEMAKVLDPSGTLFAGRVISKGDDGDLFDGDERVPKSKDLDGVLGMESAVVIIDDSVRVWPHNKHNLIVVERYTYFPCSRRQFGLLGPSLLEIDHDERPEDGTLASCLAVIERLHQIFFSHRVLNDVDVRHILASEQRKILAGCRIVFSRVFPVGEANPHLHPLWQTAEQFGAVCTNQIDEQVTHVVANSLGTDKVNWALCTGRFVVHPGWVEASALLYRRANETDFTVKL